MANKKVVSPLLMLALIATCVPHTTQCSGNNTTFAAGAITGGAAVAVGVTAGLIWKSWPSASIDPNIIVDDARKLNDKITADYANMLATIDKKQDPRTLDESALNAYASAGFYERTSDINTRLALLVHPLAALEKTVEKTKDASTRATLQAQIQALTETREHLRTIEAVLTTHKTYFDLFITHASIAKQYARAIKFVDQHKDELASKLDQQNNSTNGDNNSALHYALNGVLSLQDGASERALKYPYLHFAACGGSAIANLENSAARTDSRYPVLESQATMVTTKLYTLREHVVNNTECKNNVAAEEQVKQAQKKLQLDEAHYKEIAAIERERLQTELANTKEIKTCAKEVQKIKDALTRTDTRLDEVKQTLTKKIDNLETQFKTLDAALSQLQQRAQTADTAHLNLCTAHNQLVAAHNSLDARLKNLEKEQRPPTYESAVTQQNPPAYNQEASCSNPVS